MKVEAENRERVDHARHVFSLIMQRTIKMNDQLINLTCKEEMAQITSFETT
jgi:hypothetical protein